MTDYGTSYYGARKNLRGQYVRNFTDEETVSKKIVYHLALELEVKQG